MAETHSDAIVDTSQAPQWRVRTNVARNSSGVTFDVTTQMTWTGSPTSYICDGFDHDVDDALAGLNRKALDQLAERIEEAKALDTFVPKNGRA